MKDECFSDVFFISLWPGLAKPSQAKPDQARPSQAKPGQARPGQAKPSQVKPSQAKPSQSVNWGAEFCAKRKSTSPCLLAIPAFDRIAGLSNRPLNSNRG